MDLMSVNCITRSLATFTCWTVKENKTNIWKYACKLKNFQNPELSKLQSLNLQYAH